jgi:hypothetical protein
LNMPLYDRQNGKFSVILLGASCHVCVWSISVRRLL